METRQELLLKFMLALASNEPPATMTASQHADYVLLYAVALVDRYYETL